jgi:hypothetical protein
LNEELAHVYDQLGDDTEAARFRRLASEETTRPVGIAADYGESV